MCIYCGHSSFSDGIELHVDHVMPLDKGGSSLAKNLVAACKDCNVAKGSSVINNIQIILDEVKKRNNKMNIPSNLHIKFDSRIRIESMPVKETASSDNETRWHGWVYGGRKRLSIV